MKLSEPFPLGGPFNMHSFIAARSLRFAFLLLLFTGAFAAGQTSMQTSLLDALKQDDRAAMEAALSAGADVDAPDAHGRTTLHTAAKSKSAEVVRLLLDHGANVNAQDADGRTPLHLAHSDAADLLLARKADLKLVDRQGNTPLHTAAELESARVAYRLVESGMDVNARNSAGLTPLHFAMMQGHREPVAFLVSKGADVNAATTAAYDYKWTYVAPDVLGMEQRMPQGSTPLDLALAQHQRNKWSSGGRFTEIVDLLKLHGAKPSIASAAPTRWLRRIIAPLSLVGLLLFAWLLFHIDARMRGWHSLADRYTAADEPAGKVERHQDGVIGTWGLIHMRHMLTASVSDAGLYIAMPSWLRLAHPPLLIPWDQLKVTDERAGLEGPVIKLSAGDPALGTIVLRGGLVDEVKRKLSSPTIQ